MNKEDLSKKCSYLVTLKIDIGEDSRLKFLNNTGESVEEATGKDGYDSVETMDYNLISAALGWLDTEVAGQQVEHFARLHSTLPKPSLITLGLQEKEKENENA